MPAPMGHENYASADNLGGRPKKYTKEFIENEAEELNKWIQKDGNVFFNRFALMRGYHPQKFTEFAAQNERFQEVFTMAKKWQELVISEGAITKTFSDGFSKFVLVNHHGWSDKSETKVTGDPNAPFLCMLKDLPSTKDLVKDGEE